MQSNTKEKVLDRLATVETSVKEIKDMIKDEASAVEQVINAYTEFKNWLGVNSDNPTTTEMKEAVVDLQDKTAEIAVEKTISDVVKVAETKSEEVKSTQANDEAKAAVTKNKDAIVKDIQENVKEKKEAIKKIAVERA